MYGSAPSPAPQEMLCTSHFLFGATCVPVESVLADDRLINHVVSICGEESPVIRWMCSGALASDWSGSKGFFSERLFMSLQLVALHKHYFHTRAACTENTKEQASQSGQMTVYFKAVPGAVTKDGEI